MFGMSWMNFYFLQTHNRAVMSHKTDVTTELAVYRTLELFQQMSQQLRKSPTASLVYLSVLEVCEDFFWVPCWQCDKSWNALTGWNKHLMSFTDANSKITNSTLSLFERPRQKSQTSDRKDQKIGINLSRQCVNTTFCWLLTLTLIVFKNLFLSIKAQPSVAVLQFAQSSLIAGCRWAAGYSFVAVDITSPFIFRHWSQN